MNKQIKMTFFFLSVGVLVGLSLPTVPSARSKKPSALQQCGKMCRGKLNQMSTAKINRMLRFLQKKLSYQTRLHVLSAMFLGTPYSLGPLGEGPKGKWDKDPIFRMDRLDCVTYVETVLALARSHHLKEARERLQKIRYKDGKIRFFARNHFTAAQWLPVNEQAGFIKVVTKQVGGKWARSIKKKITPNTWKRRAWRWWRRRLPASFRPRSYTLWYVPLKDMPRVVSRLPSIGWMGEIFSRKNNPISVRHVGFFVKRKGRMLFRHANRPRVKQISLLRYAKWRLRQAKKKRRRTKIVGFSFASFPSPTQWSTTSL